MAKLIEISDEYLGDLLALRVCCKLIQSHYEEKGYIEKSFLDFIVPKMGIALERTEDSDLHQLQNLAKGLEDVVDEYLKNPDK